MQNFKNKYFKIGISLKFIVFRRIMINRFDIKKGQSGGPNLTFINKETNQ